MGWVADRLSSVDAVGHVVAALDVLDEVALDVDGESAAMEGDGSVGLGVNDLNVDLRGGLVSLGFDECGCDERGEVVDDGVVYFVGSEADGDALDAAFLDGLEVLYVDDLEVEAVVVGVLRAF